MKYISSPADEVYLLWEGQGTVSECFLAVRAISIWWMLMVQRPVP